MADKLSYPLGEMSLGMWFSMPQHDKDKWTGWFEKQGIPMESIIEMEITHLFLYLRVRDEKAMKIIPINETPVKILQTTVPSF